METVEAKLEVNVAKSVDTTVSQETGDRFVSPAPLFKCLSRLQRSGRFRVRKNFAFVFCGRKAFGGNIIKPGYLIRFVPFPFCYTPKQLRPAEGRFSADSKGENCQFSEPRCFNTVKYCFISTRPHHSGTFELVFTVMW